MNARDPFTITISLPGSRCWLRDCRAAAKAEMGDQLLQPGPLRMLLQVGVAPPADWPERRRMAAPAIWSGDWPHDVMPSLHVLSTSWAESLEGIVYIAARQLVEVVARKVYMAEPLQVCTISDPGPFRCTMAELTNSEAAPGAEARRLIAMRAAQ